MSGGVDSAVAAALLIEQGYEVVGISLKLLPEGAGNGSERADRCCSVKDAEDARLVAAQLGIPYYILNYESQFQREVIREFTEAYLGGLTPNPCVRCNELIKFGSLLQQALGLGAKRLATGHYARVEREDMRGRYLLRRGVDEERDQSYFLYSLTQEQLAGICFPVGHMTKDQVRERAAAYGLRIAAKADSQDLCFVGHDYRTFLQERCGDRLRPGPITDRTGRILGQHEGVALYTVGQRNGLRLASGPFYVIRLDPQTNAVVVGRRDELLRREFVAERLNLVAYDRLTAERPVLVKVRSRQAAMPATILPLGDSRIRVRWHQAQPAAAPGQAAVFYDAAEPDLLVGGATVAADQETQ
ncbi:MAG: tRNA 2-thiouridine(34) synthase MnmA [Candidatus Methylomirabilis oxygeniifera]|uniref:tRNA-specific 2-thiouridylase MnmA n=1 Tax=Methylomirabilis oxygeniifera TaxID=671143 RepID=D5MLX4_METO1|nr:MAG: tRNA 2-thiouridine(34) synthase MnmA [Candidatus Methylomirabilis oxyfera]CBE70031.1 tRNA (5-methylaminomethyl-2-thiouridylate)-methyltransferase [Candidatus Methylomirabilis oxyfera]